MEFILLKLFGALMVLSSFFVITANNPVHSVISLVFVFFNSSAIFFILGFEYLALVLLIVYVGAIAVLFLFVVMMLNIRRSVSFRWSGLVGFIAFIIFIFFISNVVNPIYVSDVSSYSLVNWSSVILKVTDMELIGQSLFTYHFLYVLLAGMVLLVAMVGSILLTMVHSPFVKRQVIYDQISRTVSHSVSTYRVTSN